MITEEIKEGLNARQDVEYRDFQSNLIPNVGIDYFVGVRTPELRKYAKELGKRDDVSEFLDQLPHQLFDENQLHAFIISDMKDYGKCIDTWIKSDETYTIRFAIKMLMEHFLDEDFDIKYAKMVAKVRSEEYYVNMMISWYFATALAKQYHSILPFITEKKLEKWTHNKTIQKAVESFRITPEQKTYLRTLKIK